MIESPSDLDAVAERDIVKYDDLLIENLTPVVRGIFLDTNVADPNLDWSDKTKEFLGELHANSMFVTSYRDNGDER